MVSWIVVASAAPTMMGTQIGGAAKPPEITDVPHETSDMPYVVGGVRSEPGSWPGTVALIEGDGPFAFCTGTLITPTAVLTAAHCVDIETDTFRMVRVGAVDSSQGGELLAVEAAFPHPNYPEGGDIGVVLLAESASIDPVPIAMGCVADRTLYDGAPAMLVGYGVDAYSGMRGWLAGDVSLLREAPITIFDATCSDMSQPGCVPLFDVDESGQQVPVEAAEFRASGRGSDSCFGDSGGPVYVLDEGQWYVGGVTSRGIPSLDIWSRIGGVVCGAGGVYGRPDAWIGWLESVVGPLPEPVCSGPSEPPPPLVFDMEPIRVERRRSVTIPLEVQGAQGTVRYAIVDPPAAGEATLEADGMLTYRHRKGEPNDWFRVEATDALGRTAYAVIEVQILDRGCATAPVSAGLVGGLSVLVPLVWRRRKREARSG